RGRKNRNRTRCPRGWNPRALPELLPRAATVAARRCRAVTRGIVRRTPVSARRVRGEQALERFLRAERGARVAEEPALVVRGEDQGVDLERDLPGIDARGEVAGVDRPAHDLRKRAAQLALAGDDPIAHRPRTVVVLGRRGEDGAAAGDV